MDDQAELSSPNTLTKRRDLSVIAVHLALLTCLCLLLTWPLLIHGIPDLSHDGYHHARWAKQFSTQFWNGDLFPRWFIPFEYDSGDMRRRVDSSGIPSPETATGTVAYELSVFGPAGLAGRRYLIFEV